MSICYIKIALVEFLGVTLNDRILIIKPTFIITNMNLRLLML